MSNKFQLPSPSKEQIDIIINSDNNIMVNSVAGSGKTTTILHLAKTMSIAVPDERILLLTYNKKLKIETRKKIELLELRNIEAHSYHSCATRYYGGQCSDDYKMIKIVDESESNMLPKFTRIIIDEAQDMTEIYYKFVCILIRDLKRIFPNIAVKFAVIGDKFQSIFSFNGADHRFIQYADVLFSILTPVSQWKEFKLSTSYRITYQIANFLNKVVLKEDRLVAVKSGPPVDYIICDTFSNYPQQIIMGYVNSKKYRIDEIFIIAPSVKSVKSPVRKVANYLSMNKFPVFVPGSDEEPLDEDILRGKIVFSTLHQVKGLERRCIFLFGFDQSYYDFFAKNLSKSVCPNTLYVGLTRAIEKLCIFHHSKNDYLSFLDTDQLYKYANVDTKNKICVTTSKFINNNCTVSDLTRHISAKVLYDAIQFISHEDIQQISSDCISIPTKIDGIKAGDENLTETVSEINGIALATYFEYESSGNIEILNDLIKNSDPRNIPGLVIQDGQYNFNMNAENLLKLSNKYCCHRTEYVHKLNQIQKYDWLKDDQLDLAYKIMKKHISSNCKFEVPVSLKQTIRGKTIAGRIDIFDITNCTLWEIKAVNAIKYEHIIQTAIYGFLFSEMLSDPTVKKIYCGDRKLSEIKYKLFNILEGHIVEIKFDPVCVLDMLALIINAKYFENRSIEDDKFVVNITNIAQEYLKPVNNMDRRININNETVVSNVDNPVCNYIFELESLF